MKKLIFLLSLVLLMQIARAQKTVKLDYLISIPIAMKNCGSSYTYDSVSLKKKKFIMACDLQNNAVIRVGGKTIKLLLKESNTVEKENITSYEGAGYKLILRSTTTEQKKDIDFEKGDIEIFKGAVHATWKIHGQTVCDVTKEEGNQ